MTALGLSAVILAVYAIFIIFSVWFLVPNDPATSLGQNAKSKLEIVAGFMALLVASTLLARWAFKKRARYRVSN